MHCRPRAGGRSSFLDTPAAGTDRSLWLRGPSRHAGSRETLVELAELCRFYIVETVTLDDGIVAKHLPASLVPVLDDLTSRLAALPAWDHTSIESAFQATLAMHDMKLGKLAQPVRVAVTGGTVSPGYKKCRRVGSGGAAVSAPRRARARRRPCSSERQKPRNVSTRRPP